MPSNQTPLGALTARFRRERVLIIGCGDVGQRVVQQLSRAVRVLALTSSPQRISALRAQGITPLSGNLDDSRSLLRLSGLATRVLHLAPPPSEGNGDPRTRNLLRALQLRGTPRALVYASTTGVYGDCHGAVVDETRALSATTSRAQRRVDAEASVRLLGRRTSRVRTNILRIPGIYAPNREGGTPEARLRKGTPVLDRADDVFTNHIHADDLARACVKALWCGQPQRIYNVSDNSAMRMGDYFDVAADLYGLPRPPRVPRNAAQGQLSLMLLSFMSESRRMDNTRMKTELRLRLRYPTVITGLVANK